MAIGYINSILNSAHDLLTANFQKYAPNMPLKNYSKAQQAIGYFAMAVAGTGALVIAKPHVTKLWQKISFAKAPTPLSRIEVIQQNTAAIICAKNYPLPVRIATRAIGHFALAILSLGTMGLAMPFTLSVWTNIAKNDALQSISQLPGQHKPNEIRLIDKSSNKIIKLKFTETNGKITCSHPQFMSGAIPNIALLKAAFALNAKNNKNCAYIGYRGTTIGPIVTVRNAAYMGKNILTHQLPHVAKYVTKTLWHHKHATVGVIATIALASVYTYRYGLPRLPISFSEEKQKLINDSIENLKSQTEDLRKKLDGFQKYNYIISQQNLLLEERLEKLEKIGFQLPPRNTGSPDEQLRNIFTSIHILENTAKDTAHYIAELRSRMMNLENKA